jgi:hypothetical protein
MPAGITANPLLFLVASRATQSCHSTLSGFFSSLKESLSFVTVRCIFLFDYILGGYDKRLDGGDDRPAQ